MAGNSLVTFGSALAGDVLSAFGLPGGSTLASLAGSFMEKRKQEARDILIEEISRGAVQFEEEDIDPLIATLLRFSKAVEDGAARENLVLLAQVIAGLKKNRALSGDAFNRWASILSHLTRDEVLALGKAYKIATKFPPGEDVAKSDFWKEFSEEMERSGYASGHLGALSASIARYGLLLPVSAWGGIIYFPSEWLVELGQLANLEDGGKG